MKFISKIVFATLAFFLAGVTAFAQSVEVSPDSQCGPASGTGQKVCWQVMAHGQGRMQYPIDGNYWHKMVGINRALALSTYDGRYGVQNTKYLGRAPDGNHLYQEVQYLDGVQMYSHKVLVDHNDNTLRRH